MKIYSDIPADLPPTALTIGTFDGVHLGHQVLLKRLRAVAPYATVITFSNHPLEILKPEEPIKLLTSLPQKLALFEKYHLNAVIAIPFTLKLASLTYDAFLAPFPLTHLVLGVGSAFGKNREGNPANLLRLAQVRGFKLEYVEKVMIDGAPVSSKRIRDAIASDDLETASRLIGRPLLKEVHV